MVAPPKKKSGNNSGGLLRYVCYLFVSGIIFGLIVSCITLSILLRGAKHAHHELWEQMNAQGLFVYLSFVYVIDASINPSHII